MPLGDQRRFDLPSRRQLLVGGGVGAGLLVGWALWPRDYAPNLVANPGETVLGGFLKIAESGQVTVIVPQAETGQGVYTALPQILADELGADWRTVAVEPAPLGPLYANRLFAREAAGGSRVIDRALGQLAEARAGDAAFMLTGGSSSVRAFEGPLRAAGASARALLCMAAGARWDADWRACDTAEGFVVRGEERLRFGELAAEAARFDAPDPAPLRTGTANRLTGKALPRLDLPAKIDGSARFAGDIRLPDMAYASIRQGPPGHRGLSGFDRKAADAVPGVIAVVDTPGWVATIATNWWAANRALDAMRPRFAMPDKPASTVSIERALREAVEGDGVRTAAMGDLAEVFRGQTLRTADYAVGPAAHAALETLTATARFRGGTLELWIATEAPAAARTAAARALGIAESAVTIYPMLGGGSWGRLLENEAGAQAAVLAARMNRPVQLIWSRAEDLTHDLYRPPAFARMSAKIASDGRIQGWLAKIAAPASGAAQAGRLFGGSTSLSIGGPPVAGAIPPYAIPAYAIDHHAADLALPTGHWRSGPHSYTAFFTECFVDELAKAAGLEPLSFRMQSLGDNPRLARCLATVAALGGWEGGGLGTGQGLACHMMAGSHVAILAEANVNQAQRVSVTRVVAVADVGRVINPDLVRQQIEGGIQFAIAAATGAPIDFEAGMAVPRNFAQLGLPRLAGSPEIVVELVRSNEPSGGASEIAVPPVAPAIANALAAGTGARLRSLPLRPGAA